MAGGITLGTDRQMTPCFTGYKRFQWIYWVKRFPLLVLSSDCNLRRLVQGCVYRWVAWEEEWHSFLAGLVGDFRLRYCRGMNEWDKCMTYTSSAFVFQKIFGITQPRVSDILFAERQLSVMLPFFSSSIDIVLMLAHVFSAFVELEYVNHFLFCLSF